MRLQDNYETKQMAYRVCVSGTRDLDAIPESSNLALCYYMTLQLQQFSTLQACAKLRRGAPQTRGGRVQRACYKPCLMEN